VSNRTPELFYGNTKRFLVILEPSNQRSSPKMTQNYRTTGLCTTTCNILNAAFSLVKVTGQIKGLILGMAIYEASFVFLSTICLLLYLLTANSSQQSAASGDGSFRKFQRKYLTVYLMAQGRVCLFQ